MQPVFSASKSSTGIHFEFSAVLDFDYFQKLQQNGWKVLLMQQNVGNNINCHRHHRRRHQMTSPISPWKHAWAAATSSTPFQTRITLLNETSLTILSISFSPIPFDSSLSINLAKRFGYLKMLSNHGIPRKLQKFKKMSILKYSGYFWSLWSSK